MKTHSIFLLLISILLIQIGLVSAQSIDDRIIFHTFNAEYARADTLIAEQIRQDPNHPKYYYLRATLAFYSRYFGNSGLEWNELLQLVAENAQKAVDAAEGMEEKTEVKFYLGSAYSYLSRAHFLINRSLYDGYFAARKGRNYLEEVIEEDPNYYDAYLNLAVLEYFTATRLTGWQETFAWFLGMSGEKETAFEYFKLAEENGNLCKEEAKLILTLLYRFLEPDSEKADAYFKNYTEKYPNNTWMKNLYLQSQLIQLIADKGVAYLESEIGSLQVEYNINRASLLNGIGYNYINKDDLESALRVFQLNIRLFPDVANCYDSLGEAYMLLGNNDEAIKHYQTAFQKVETDTTINENRREFVRNNIKTQLEKLNAL